MQTQRTRLFSCIAAGLMGAGVMFAASPAAAFDPSLSASVGISNMYLFRGVDLSTGGNAHVSGSLDFDSGVGLYTGVWAASGDSNLGQEYDLYAGYATDITDDVSVDVGAINYIYPSQDRSTSPDLVGDFSEVYLNVEAYGASLGYVDTVAGLPGYSYITAGYGYDAFSATVGHHSFDDAAQGNSYGGFGEDMTHLDLSFQFNDELAFTASTIVDVDNDDATRRSTLIQAVYSKSFSL